MALHDILGIHTRHSCGCLEGTDGTIPCDLHEPAWALVMEQRQAAVADLERDLDVMLGFDPIDPEPAADTYKELA